jgi:hypothetical protein
MNATFEGCAGFSELRSCVGRREALLIGFGFLLGNISMALQ